MRTSTRENEDYSRLLEYLGSRLGPLDLKVSRVDPNLKLNFVSKFKYSKKLGVSLSKVNSNIVRVELTSRSTPGRVLATLVTYNYNKFSIECSDPSMYYDLDILLYEYSSRSNSALVTANRCIRGDYGNGSDRIFKLRSEGHNPGAVQSAVDYLAVSRSSSTDRFNSTHELFSIKVLSSDKMLQGLSSYDVEMEVIDLQTYEISTILSNIMSVSHPLDLYWVGDQLVVKDSYGSSNPIEKSTTNLSRAHRRGVVDEMTYYK